MSVRDARPVSTILTYDEELHRTYTSVYQVLSDKYENPVGATSAPGLPLYGTSYHWYGFFDTWAFAKSVEVDRNPITIADPQGVWGESYLWYLTYTHTSRPSGDDDNVEQPKENPLVDPPAWSGSFSPFSRLVHRDKDGNPIINTGGDPPEQAPQIQDAFDTIRVSWNSATVDLGIRRSYRHKVNSQTFWGLPVRSVKMMRWGYQVLYSGKNMPYIKNDLEFLVSDVPQGVNVCEGTKPGMLAGGLKGFYNTLPNVGPRYFGAGTLAASNAKVFTDAQDNPQSRPGRLSCDGDKLKDDLPQLYNVWALEEEADFNGIPSIPALSPVIT